ncbi:MAG: polyphosphate kinase 2 family protein [Lentisphaeria bacterium]|nr:polyphosphate kinase 2 family protein [Lentisphaeria bacterium]
MKPETFIRQAAELSRAYRVSKGTEFHLADWDPRDTGHDPDLDKSRARKLLQAGVEAMAELQDMLYAQDRWALLLIFQAMDAAGKDSAIKHVMSGINPQGCQVYSFKTPSHEELDHDYLWRCLKNVPERGRIGIFNRSYYEEVLIVRVHPEILDAQKLPRDLVTKRIWEERFQDMRNVERYLTRNGIVMLKFCLNLSAEEQKQRFLARLDEPDKHWKFAPEDVREREYWERYRSAYEEMIRGTASSWAPWYVVPADHKWYTRLVVAAAVVSTLSSLDLKYPALDPERRKDLAAARAALEEQGEQGGAVL